MICWAKRSPRRSIRVCATMCANGGLPLKIFRCVWLFIIVRERTYTPAVRIIPLTDWVEDRQRSREWLDRLVKQLNSAEDLDATSGEFFTELVFAWCWC